jgi:DNA-binding IclR family transcriptional regulator
VFKALQQAPSLSLQEVHAATRLPKPSLLRILATLAGMVHRRLVTAAIGLAPS